MHSGLLVLSATIGIGLLLQAWPTVLGIDLHSYKLETVSLELQGSKLFRQLMAKYDPTVLGWITGDRHVHIKNLLSEVFEDDLSLQSYVLSLFSPADRASLLRNKELLVPVTYDEKGRGRLAGPNTTCSSFVKVYWTDYAAGILGQDYGDEEDLPAGCQYVDGDLNYKKYLLCESETVKSFPKLPTDYPLDVFEMNYTEVKSIRPGAFLGTDIKIIRINKNMIRGIHPRAFEGLRGTEFLQIDYNPMPWFWFEESLAGLKQTELVYMEYNQISYEGVGIECQEKEVEDIGSVLPVLKHLTLKGNPLKVIPKTLFVPLRDSPLYMLILENCQLNYIHPEALSFIPHLKHLNIAENPYLKDNLAIAFQGLQNVDLTQLNLAHNSLINIPKEALAYVASTLEGLDLRGNELKTLTKDSFPDNMSKMTQLNFEGCMLTSVEELTFQGMPNLETLVFKGNRLRTIPPPVSRLLNLNILDMSFNADPSPHFPYRLEIPPGTFTNLTKMRMLLMSNTEIGELKAGTFSGMLKLNMLVLGDTSLGSIEDHTFSELAGLRVLDLKNNPVRGLSANTFYGLGLLSTLYLQNTDFELPPTQMPSPNLVPEIDFVTFGGVLNQGIRDAEGEVSDIAGRPFYYLGRLQYLYLNDNRIRTLRPEIFDTMPLLHHLELNQNKIGSWETPLFLNNTVLTELYLPQNGIIKVTDAMLTDFTAVNINIDLANNPFICDLGTCELKKQIEDSRFSLTEWSDPNLYTCIMTSGPDSGVNVQIASLTPEFCSALVTNAPEPTTPSTTESGPTTIPTESPFEGTSVGSTTKRDDFEQGSSSSPSPSSTPAEDRVGDILEPSSPSLVTLVLISCGASVVLVLGVTCYVKRLQLRYFWFVVRLNFKKIPSRRSKTSELIGDAETGYDYDVFISYSHYDSGFIQDQLVPELEGTGKLIEKPGLEREDSGFSNPALDLDSLSTSSAGSFRVCLHERDFEVGTPITENIIESVDRSRKIIVVVSRKYLQSQWCLFEMNLAYHRLVEARRRSFVVILLEEVPQGERTKVLNYLMRSRTYLEWPQGPSSDQEQRLFWKRLKRSLASEE